ncbi:MAG: TIGR04255 family protein [Bacteriovorax sp.]|nr:TIGR04255 family protein [Bacteriovorax sp.]
MKSKKICYTNSPLLETVFEVRFKNELNILDKEVTEFYKKISSDYPKSHDVFTTAVNLKLAMKGGVPSEAQALSTENILNKRFTSTDSKKVIHLSSQSFANSMLQPYLGWDISYTSFQNSLNVFRNLFGDIKLGRIGVRSINRWTFPADKIDEYLQLKPGFQPGDFSTVVTRAGMNFSVFNEMLNLHCEIRLQLNPKKGDNVLEIEANLDVFVYRLVDNDLSDDEVNELFLNVRKLKNDIFESSIGQKSREKFDE